MDEVVYQASVGIRIETHTDFFLYKNPATGSLLAGTYPQRIRRGVQAGSVIVVGTDAGGRDVSIQKHDIQARRRTD